MGPNVPKTAILIKGGEKKKTKKKYEVMLSGDASFISALAPWKL